MKATAGDLVNLVVPQGLGILACLGLVGIDLLEEDQIGVELLDLPDLRGNAALLVSRVLTRKALVALTASQAVPPDCRLPPTATRAPDPPSKSICKRFGISSVLLYSTCAQIVLPTKR
jgi:hypothetical protein